MVVLTGTEASALAETSLDDDEAPASLLELGRATYELV